MNASIERFINRLSTAIILKSYGWVRRKWRQNNEPVTQWQDPHTGIWYSNKAALKIAKVQALDQLDLK